MCPTLFTISTTCLPFAGVINRLAKIEAERKRGHAGIKPVMKAGKRTGDAGNFTRRTAGMKHIADIQLNRTFVLP